MGTTTEATEPYRPNSDAMPRSARGRVANELLAKPTACVGCGGKIPVGTPTAQLAYVSAPTRPNGKGWVHADPTCEALETGGFRSAAAASSAVASQPPATPRSAAIPPTPPAPRASEPVSMAAAPALAGARAKETRVRVGDRLSMELTIPGPAAYTSVRFRMERDADPAATVEEEYAEMAECLGAQADASAERAWRAAGRAA